ncbi:hypothetical protein VNO78_19370 [Psophocarpus tetragonolobus]|uniref:Uncharacterized protein n=1 Tax=Psophocarpus tetragonolobus TaxID=3891 RepID=A0AAN9S841_PSOTE
MLILGSRTEGEKKKVISFLAAVDYGIKTIKEIILSEMNVFYFDERFCVRNTLDYGILLVLHSIVEKVFTVLNKPSATTNKKKEESTRNIRCCKDHYGGRESLMSTHKKKEESTRNRGLLQRPLWRQGIFDGLFFCIRNTEL